MPQGLIEIVIIPMVQITAVFLGVSLIVAYLTLMERKVLGYMQLRPAPRRVGWNGVLQPIADGLKLLIKEDIIPEKADKVVFILAPVISIVPAFIAFAVVPFSGTPIEIFGYSIAPIIADVNIGVLYILAVTSLSVFGIVLAGWSSNSKYPMLGSMRSAAQMISYEVPLGFSVIGVLMITGTASMVGIVEWQRDHGMWLFLPQLVALFLYFVSGVAETNRTPFDLPEAESELVSGYFTEYSGMRFSFFFMAEYAAMVGVAAVVVTLYFGGWLRPFPNAEWLDWLRFIDFGWIHPMLSGVFWFLLKIYLVLFTYMWLRATFPRYRYDQLMALGWKWMIPLSIVNVIGTAIVLLMIR